MPQRRVGAEKYQYIPVEAGEEEAGQASDVSENATAPDMQRTTRRSTSWTQAVLGSTIICVVALAGVTGFVLGRLPADNLAKSRCSQVQPSGIESPIQLDPVTVKFESNRSFLQHPSLETEELWKTLYPDDTHGLFEYPDENPERSGFAAFHQLHCIDALRRGYYQADDVKRALSDGTQIPTFEHEVDETHTLHCIEFLRQSIMCHADTTIQTEAKYHQGIMAFGVEYQCKNWWQLVDWVNERNRKA